MSAPPKSTLAPKQQEDSKSADQPPTTDSVDDLKKYLLFMGEKSLPCL